MKATLLSTAAALVTLATIGPGTAASGGGGCGQPPTHGKGTTVRMVRACMTPTVLRTDAGAAVTFVNGDDMAHNVASLSFFEDLPRRDDSTEIRFDVPGVYPYSCTLHAGMTGAVVVGDGAGPGQAVVEAATATAEAAAKPVEPTLVANVDPESDDDDAGSEGVATPIVATGALVVAAASAGLGRGSARRRRPGS